MLVSKKINLDSNILALLEVNAGKVGLQLNDYIQQILRENAYNFEFSEEYRIMMDKMLFKYENSELNFIDEDEFRKQIKR